MIRLPTLAFSMNHTKFFLIRLRQVGEIENKKTTLAHVHICFRVVLLLLLLLWKLFVFVIC